MSGYDIKADRRQVDALLLGRQLRPDLPRAAPPLGGRADRGPGAEGGAQAHASTASPTWARGARGVADRAAADVRDPRRGPAQAVLRRRRRLRPRSPRSRPSCAATRPKLDSACARWRHRRDASGFAALVLRYGIESSEWMVGLVPHARPSGCARRRHEPPRPNGERPRTPGAPDRGRSSSSSPARSAAASPSRLDPYGADDPATESVSRRPAPGGRRLPRAPGSSSCSRARTRSPPVPAVGPVDADAASRPRRRLGASSPARVARLRLERRRLHVPRGRPEADRRQAAPGRRRADRRRRSAGEPGVTVGGPALAQEQVNEQVESDLRTRRAARVPAAVPALAAVLPQPRRGAAAAARRRRSRSSARS